MTLAQFFDTKVGVVVAAFLGALSALLLTVIVYWLVDKFRD